MVQWPGCCLLLACPYLSGTTVSIGYLADESTGKTSTKTPSNFLFLKNNHDKEGNEGVTRLPNDTGHD